MPPLCHGFPALLLFLAAFAAPAAAQTPAAPDYSKPATWLCLPGRTDICSTPLATTALNPNGYGSVGRSSVAANPPVDCFYIYPTVSNDRGLNSDMVADNNERSVTQSQFARLSGVCRTFAPIYRQMTVSAIAARATGGQITPAALLAYGDVASAFRTYLARHNKGRPFVLIGHSQGSLMLIELIKREIDGKPLQRSLLRAYLPGYNVLVPQGRTVGGTFRSVPLCTSPTQTGCVMSWVSYRERNPPPAGAMFGYAEQPGMTVACTNPARPGSTGWERLDSYFSTRSSLPVPGGPISWSSEGPPPTPYVRTEGLVSARCINDGQRGYLSVRTNADPRDKRTDRIGGEVGLLGFFLPGWGMHLADAFIAQGDVMRQVEQLGGQVKAGAIGTGTLPARDMAMTPSAFHTPYRGGLVGNEHHFALTVYFEDTDTAQIVYYANYLKFLDRARTDMLEAIGISHAEVHRSGLGAYAVASVDIRYLSSAHVGDHLVVLTRLEQVRAAALLIHQRVMRGTELLADARVTAAFITPEGRPQRQPKDWIDKFNALIEREE